MILTKRVHEGQGFTLVEVIMVIVLTSILGIFTFQYFTSSLRSFKTFSVRKEKSDDANLALDRMSREIRDAQLSTVSLSTGIVTFQRGNTTDPDLYDTNPWVRFELSSSEIKRKSASTSGGLDTATGYTIARNVQSFTPSSGANNTVVLNVRFSPASGSSYSYIEWKTTVYPRN